jgi:hypothetical protein
VPMIATARKPDQISRTGTVVFVLSYTTVSRSGNEEKDDGTIRGIRESRRTSREGSGNGV